MRNIFCIFKRELLSFFVSPIAYFVITGFVVIAGYFFFNLLAYFNYVLNLMAANPYRGAGPMPNLNQLVIGQMFQSMMFVLILVVPLLTMRLIAEERRSGTFELLVTSPVSVGEIVLGKFLGVVFVLLLMCGLTFLLPALLLYYGNPEIGPMLTGLLGLVLFSSAFASIGMAVSSFTENQIVAGVSSLMVLLILFIIDAPAESLGGVSADVLTYLSPVRQVDDLLRGVVTSKALVYFGSLTLLGLFLSQRALDAYRWR